MIENSPEGKRLETASFVVHATRGVIRDQKTRRKAMVFCLAFAVLMLLAGFTVFQTTLNPREHPWFVISFWIACVWLTFTAMLIAIFDLLIIRQEARRAQRALREKLEADASNK
jgi:TRAP-type C4-dicarboxylate transport system permease small subunit